MMSRTRGVFAALSLVILAGCGGGAHSVPPGARTTESVQSGAQRTTSTLKDGTLYYATTSTVYALPLNAKGNATATRSITPHPEQQGITTAVATNADGTLDVQQNYFDDTGEHCRTDVEPANADGSPASTTVACDDTTPGTQGDGVARNGLGGFDILYNTPNSFIVKRFAADGASLTNTLTLGPPGFAGLYLDTDRSGGDYLVNSGGEIREYGRHATSVDNTLEDCTVSAYYGDGPLAVSTEKSIYLVVRTQGDLANSTIQEITSCPASGPAVVSRTIGPFPTTYISALTVDNAGRLYVGLNAIDGASQSTIAVFDKTANGTSAPTRVISPNPSTNFIRGLTTYEPPPATPAPSPTPVPTPAPSPTP